MQTGKGRQQGGVDVDQPALVAPHKVGRENAHESSQHHQRRPMTIDALYQGLVVGLAAFKRPVIEDLGGQASLAGEGQARCVSAAADDGHDLGPERLGPLLPSSRLNQGL